MNERDIIGMIAGVAAAGGQGGGGLLKGIGDDCAVVAGDEGRVWLYSVDTLVEAVHFDCGFHPPEKLGRKAVSVNVSDIAAMGGRPCYLLLSLGLPEGFSQSWLEGFTAGFGSACREYGCLLMGGDTVRSREITITVTVVGEMAARQVLYRSAARPGDTIWVSGGLGRAAAGLALLKHRSAKSPPMDEELEGLMEAHLDPVARVGLGQLLAASGLVHAMMDISDGPATDLAHICRQSGVGALLEAELLPVSPALSRAAALLGLDLPGLMLSGGEDFELLFTAAASDSRSLQRLTAGAGYTIQRIGRIVTGDRVHLVSAASDRRQERLMDITDQGYDHFRTRQR